MFIPSSIGVQLGGHKTFPWRGGSKKRRASRRYLVRFCFLGE